MSEEVSLKEHLSMEIKNLGDSICKRVDRVDITLKEHNGRLKAGEMWRERIVGMFITASALISVLAFIIGGLIFPAIIKAIK